MRAAFRSPCTPIDLAGPGDDPVRPCAPTLRLRRVGCLRQHARLGECARIEENAHSLPDRELAEFVLAGDKLFTTHPECVALAQGKLARHVLHGLPVRSRVVRYSATPARHRSRWPGPLARTPARPAGTRTRRPGGRSAASRRPASAWCPAVLSVPGPIVGKVATRAIGAWPEAGQHDPEAGPHDP